MAKSTAGDIAGTVAPWAVLGLGAFVLYKHPEYVQKLIKWLGDAIGGGGGSGGSGGGSGGSGGGGGGNPNPNNVPPGVLTPTGNPAMDSFASWINNLQNYQKTVGGVDFQKLTPGVDVPVVGPVGIGLPFGGEQLGQATNWLIQTMMGFLRPDLVAKAATPGGGQPNSPPFKDNGGTTGGVQQWKGVPYVMPFSPSLITQYIKSGGSKEGLLKNFKGR